MSCNLPTVIDLGELPLANSLYETREESLSATRYPLRSVLDDSIIRLDLDVDPSILYKNYFYHSSVNAPYIKHCKEMYNSCKHLNMEVMIDIGGNDGTLLDTFNQESKVNTFWSSVPPKRLINVDASDSFKESNEEKGIEYVCGFFNEEMNLPKANLITSTNVFQHTKDCHKFLRAIQKFLDGLWILEFPYTPITLETLQFDQFYHEHYYYWTLTALLPLLEQYGLKVIHYTHLPIHGGSMRLWITNKSPSASQSNLSEILDRESKIDYENFSTKVKDKIQSDISFIKNLKGKTAFFGAAAKGSVYLNSLGLTSNLMPDSYIVDDTKHKQNYYMGGTGFEIKSREYLYEDQPDNLIVLAHNFKDFIEESIKPYYNGNVISMFPVVNK